jgi:hypothetical protein
VVCFNQPVRIGAVSLWWRKGQASATRISPRM